MNPPLQQDLDLIQMNDLDRGPLPTDFPDYRDLMVMDAAGQNIGRIVDIIINRADKTPLMAVVLFGGFLDIGAKHILVPFDLLRNPKPTTITADVLRYQAEQSPDFDPKNVTDYEAYFHYWKPTEIPAVADPMLAPVEENSALGHGPLVRIARAAAYQVPSNVEDLRGKQVVGADDQAIGVIDDWFLNMTTHRPEIVVIRHGGVFGVFGHESMVPFSRLDVVDSTTLRAQVTKEEFEGAPELKDEIYDYKPFFEYWGIATAAETPKVEAPANEPLVEPRSGEAVRPTETP